MVQIEQAWSEPVKRDALPVPNPYAHTNLIYTSKGRQAIISKLDRIRLDNVMYDGIPLSEVVRNLSEEAKSVILRRGELISSSTPMRRRR